MPTLLIRDSNGSLYTASVVGPSRKSKPLSLCGWFFQAADEVNQVPNIVGG